MSELIVVTRAGDERVVPAGGGLTVMEAIRDAGLDELLALCGGCCSCATCHVYVDTDSSELFEPMGEDENDLLDSSDHRQPNSRLSCQLRMTGDLAAVRVTIAPED